MTIRKLYILFACGVLGFYALSAAAGWKPPSLELGGSGGGGGYRSYGGSGGGK